MSTLISRITDVFKPVKMIPAGIFHYQTPETADSQFRLHLRVNQNGEGLLIINASTILHLNQTATEYAYHLVKEDKPEVAAKKIASRYQINQNDAQLDFIDFRNKVMDLIEIPDLDPVSFLDISREDPYSGAVTSPYRLDCALTYRLPQKANPDLAPIKRVDKELNTEEWLTIINKAWDAGIPHLIFTGGEPTLREDLIEIIKQAEDNGQVTGLLTDGYKLSQADFRQQLLESGLDHLLFALSPLDQDSWSSLQAILEEDLYTTVHITITKENVKNISQFINKSKELGANAMSLSNSDPSDQQLEQALSDAQTLVAEADLPLKWDLPVPYSKHNPIYLEMKKDHQPILGSGKAWFYVEPDGDLLPSQGVDEVLGNLLVDNWSDFWR
jgi:organic radical activating enzyme